MKLSSYYFFALAQSAPKNREVLEPRTGLVPCRDIDGKKEWTGRTRMWYECSGEPSPEDASTTTMTTTLLTPTATTTTIATTKKIHGMKKLREQAFSQINVQLSKSNQKHAKGPKFPIKSQNQGYI